MGDAQAIVIDPGSGYIKAGLRTEDAPTAVFPTIVGVPRARHRGLFEGEPSFVGDDAVANREYLSFSYPLDHGHLDEAMQIEEIWSYVFNSCLKLQPEHHPICISHAPMASNKHREIFCESLFEGHGIPELNLSMQAILSIYATGRTTGLVVEIGEGVTQVAPIFEGYSERGAVRRSDFGGQEVSMYLQKLLCDNGYQLTTRDEFDHVRIIKESLCFISHDQSKEASRSDLEVTYTLPDGTTLADETTTEIVLSTERYLCPEVIFDPSLMQRDNPPLTKLIWQSVQSSALEVRKPCLSAVIVSGGCTMFPGFSERLEKELKLSAPMQARGDVKLAAADDRLFNVWLGGKLFTDPGMRPMQDELWISASEWTDEGPAVLSRKALHP